MPQKLLLLYSICLIQFVLKKAFLATEVDKCGETTHYCEIFIHYRQFGGLFAFLTPSNPTPCPGSPPTSSRCTKQILNCAHGL